MFDILWWHYPLFFLAGSLVSFCNAVAGGGSILSLPLLLFFGADVAYANGTNRLAVFMGLTGATLKFRKEGMLEEKNLLYFGLPALLGSIVGTFIVLDMKGSTFRIILAFVILLIVVFIFKKDSLRKERNLDWLPQNVRSFFKYGIVFFAGLYGGLIQVGLGYILISIFSLTFREDLVRTNAMKVLTALFIIATSVVIFMLKGTVMYVLAISMGCGNFVGGYLGSHFQIKYGVRWVEWFLLVMGVVIAVKLVYDSLSTMGL